MEGWRYVVSISGAGGYYSLDPRRMIDDAFIDWDPLRGKWVGWIVAHDGLLGALRRGPHWDTPQEAAAYVLVMLAVG